MGKTENIPQKPGFWFGRKKSNFSKKIALDTETLVICFAITAFVILFFAPIVSRMDFNEVFLTPSVPALASILRLAGVEMTNALKIIYIQAFVIASLGIYLLVKDSLGRQIPAILATIIFLIPPIPLYIQDFFRRGLNPEQLEGANTFFSVWYGDVSHFLAVAFIPFAIIFFQKYLSFAKTFNFVVAVSLCAVILLTNVSHSLTLLMILVVVAFNSLLLGAARIMLQRLFFVVIFTLGLISFWYSPSFIVGSFATFVSLLLDNLRLFFPLPVIVSIIGLITGYIFFGKREDRRLIFISFLVFSAFVAISADWIINNRSFLPSPHRLLPPINLFGSIVASIFITALIDNFSFLKRFGNQFRHGVDKSLLYINFGLAFFIVLLIGVNLIKPWLLRFFSGTHGIWTRVRQNVVVDQHELITSAGGNYTLIEFDKPFAELILGLIITGAFSVWLIFLLVRAIKIKEKD